MYNKKDLIYKPMQGVWQCVSGDSETLADTLQRLGIIIDDKCQFARMYDYANKLCIEYRAYTEAKIIITIWQL